MPGKKILVVDDAKAFQDIYRNRLSPEGYLVSSAGNGMEAIQLAKRDRPDLILLDLNMPVMDGFKVLQALRADDALSGVRVIVLTSDGKTEVVDKAISLGADGYLVKATATPNEVVEKVKEILGG